MLLFPKHANLFPAPALSFSSISGEESCGQFYFPRPTLLLHLLTNYPLFCEHWAKPDQYCSHIRRLLAGTQRTLPWYPPSPSPCTLSPAVSRSSWLGRRCRADDDSIIALSLGQRRRRGPENTRTAAIAATHHILRR